MLSVIIKAVHTLLIAFIVLVPLLSNDERWLTYHFVVVPMIIVHWLTNNNICALTQLEAMISGTTNTNETFIGKFVNPVYDMRDEVIWIITGGLWLLTALKLQATNWGYLRAVIECITKG